jgi:hypothetical protein
MQELNKRSQETKSVVHKAILQYRRNTRHGLIETGGVQKVTAMSETDETLYYLLFDQMRELTEADNLTFYYGVRKDFRNKLA